MSTVIISDVIPSNRDCQYRTLFATADPDFAPQLPSVAITPDHPAIAASQGSCALGDGTFTCTIGTLAPSETATVTAQVNIHPSVLGPITNTAALSSTEGLTATVETVSQVEAVSDLYLVKHDYADPVNVGGLLTYSIDVTNTGSYTFWLRAFGPTGSDDSCYVAIAGAAPVTVNLSEQGSCRRLQPDFPRHPSLSGSIHHW